MATITIPAKYLRASLHCAAKADIRPYLNGVCVEVNQEDARIISTDGMVMAVIRFEHDGSIPAASIIIGREHIEALKIGKKALYDVELTYGDGDTATLQYGAVSLKFAPMDYVFPDYRKVIPSKLSNEPGLYNPALLVKFSHLAEALGEKPPTITQNGKDDTAMVTFSSQECIGVIMPMRGPAFGIPEWVYPEHTANVLPIAA